jgi:succinate dehydrogenase hydrophobic anchor subunit
VYILFLSLVLPYGRYQNTYQRFAAVVGIPLAMCAAFVVVAILEQTSGPIEVSAPGFSIKGAAGQVLFWLFVFLAIVHAIEVLWPLTSAG